MVCLEDALLVPQVNVLLSLRAATLPDRPDCGLRGSDVRRLLGCPTTTSSHGTSRLGCRTRRRARQSWSRSTHLHGNRSRSLYLLTGQHTDPRRQWLVGKMIERNLCVDEVLDVGIGRSKREGHAIGVRVTHPLPLPQAPLPLVVAESVAAVEMPRHNVMTPRAVNDPLQRVLGLL